MSMATVWFQIAERIRRGDGGGGPFICNLAATMLGESCITRDQYKAVLIAIRREGRRQIGELWHEGCALWRDWRDCHSLEQVRVVRIQFCTNQIRKVRR